MSLLPAAMKAVASGYAIFPCNPCGTVCPETGDVIDKRSHLIWPHKPYKLRWAEAATRNPDMIVRWWLKSPQANPAIAMRPSRLLVVDCDTKGGEYGVDQYIDLCETLLKIDPAEAFDTYTVLTGSGGLHLYYRWPEDVQASQAGIAPLVDIRSNGGNDGGYVLAAGSVTSKGTYQVSRDVPVRDCPPELIELCKERPKPARPKSRYAQPGGGNRQGLVDSVRFAHEGNRSNCLYWATRAMYDDGVDLEEAIDLLVPAAAEAGLHERDAEATVRSGYRAQQRKNS